MKNILKNPLRIISALVFTMFCTNCGETGGNSIAVLPSTSGEISFSPTTGYSGTILTITSSDADLTSPISVTVGGVPAFVLSSSTSSLSVLAVNTVSGPVVVTPATGSAITSAADFNSIATTPIATQQGTPLIGTGNVGNATQGVSVALSADGNTALIGGNNDDGGLGATWVFTRSGSSWTQQGAKLVGTGNTGNPGQGRAVALSADGNTALIGGSNDNGSVGATWVFTRSGNSWTQQGAKLVGTGNVGNSAQGRKVALSADGNTALIGGSSDNGGAGAVWVFTRSGSSWTQQGAKLVGTGNVGNASQGSSLALSADGNTALIGGDNDNGAVGAVWVFTRSGSTWTQQGAKLVGTGNVGAVQYGSSVALSADGNTALFGGYPDNTNQGAVWIFTRSGSTWTQQGTKLVGTGNVGNAQQGSSVALSADGNTALAGGSADNTNQGAAWVFIP